MRSEVIELSANPHFLRNRRRTHFTCPSQIFRLNLPDEPVLRTHPPPDPPVSRTRIWGDDG
jgi:hypothetical protein